MTHELIQESILISTKMLKFIVVFLFIITTSFAQENARISYGADYLFYFIHEQDTIGLPEMAKLQLAKNERLKKNALAGNNDIFTLEISASISKFTFTEFMNADDSFSFATLYMAARLQPILKFENQLYAEKDFFKVQRSYEPFNISINWKIKEEFKTILDYECQLAEAELMFMERKYKVKAWFTTEIPIPEGPSFFKGLPGLILGLEKHGRYIYAKSIEFPDELEIEIPKELTKKAD